ncbi:MAG TPA: Rv1535 domain-containing protein [Mycobacterium sp.]|nr:Rv1535 domain-containing protein [Mycobacterium sp.]
MAGGLPSRIVCHWLPSRHVVFGSWTSALPRVEVVSGDAVSGRDPLTEAVSRVLELPLRELYALLWRAGVVQIVD